MRPGAAKSGDARLLEVGLELFDGRDPVDFLGLDIHELLLGSEHELDQVRDLDVTGVGNAEGMQLFDDVAGDLRPLGQVQLFERPKDAVERVQAELALGLLRASGHDSERGALRLSLDRFVHSQDCPLRGVWLGRSATTVRANSRASQITFVKTCKERPYVTGMLSK